MATPGNGNGNGTAPPTTLPGSIFDFLPPELAGLLGVIASGVTEVAYADRRIKYAGIGDLLKAWPLLASMAGVGGPRRRFACFSKGFDTGWGGIEHQEIRDALFSREVPASLLRTEDVDWERAR
jgi:hypothetical protein